MHSKTLIHRDKELRQRDEELIHEAFGLSYASWFVTPRVVLEAMSAEWQHRFVELIDELNEKFDWEPDCVMEVRFRKNGTFIKVPEYYRNYRRPDYKWLGEITNKME